MNTRHSKGAKGRGDPEDGGVTDHRERSLMGHGAKSWGLIELALAGAGTRTAVRGGPESLWGAGWGPRSGLWGVLSPGCHSAPLGLRLHPGRKTPVTSLVRVSGAAVPKHPRHLLSPLCRLECEVEFGQGQLLWGL